MAIATLPVPESSTDKAELLSVNEVAEILNCSQRHVYRLSAAGACPSPIKLGSLVRWSRASITEWIANDCPPVAS